MEKKLLCFDLDGTLIDSAADVVTAMNATLNEYGRESLPTAVIVSYIGEGLLKLVNDIFSEITDPKIHDEITEKFLKNYEKHMFESTTVFPGVFEFFQKWNDPIAIITNKNIGPTHEILKHLGLDQLPWKKILGADSLPEKKPSPLPLKTVMAELGISAKNTWMIGDGTPDMISAQKASVKSIAIGFGYTKVEILQQHNPVAVLPHYDKLRELIFSH